MATYGAKTGIKSFGIGGLVTRLLVGGALTWAGLSGGNWALNAINNNAPTAPGFVNPKSLSVETMKDAQGNLETYLQQKIGNDTISIPCYEGPMGPLCGITDYWWMSIGKEEKEELAVAEWPQISNNAKHGIMTSELQTIIDSFYGAQPQQKHNAKEK